MGGIPHDTTRSELFIIFKKFGPINSITIPKNEDKTLKGFAVINFKKDEFSKRALKNPTIEVRGKQVSIKPYCVSKEKSSDAQPYSKFENLKIFVVGFDQKAREKKVKDFFEQFGHVSHVKLIIEPKSGRLRGFGYLEMTDLASYKRVI